MEFLFTTDCKIPRWYEQEQAQTNIGYNTIAVYLSLVIDQARYITETPPTVSLFHKRACSSCGRGAGCGAKWRVQNC